MTDRVRIDPDTLNGAQVVGFPDGTPDTEGWPLFARVAPRPISAAPRDGEKVLAWWPPTYEPGAWMTTWRTVKHGIHAWEGANTYAYDGDDHAPTHFLPHPKAPHD